MSTPVDLGVLRARTGCGGAIAEDRGLEGHSRGPNEAVGETYWLAGAGIGHRGEMPLEGELDIARDSLCGLPQVSGADENGAYKWRPATFVPRPLSLASCAALLYPCLS